MMKVKKSSRFWLTKVCEQKKTVLYLGHPEVQSSLTFLVWNKFCGLELVWKTFETNGIEFIFHACLLHDTQHHHQPYEKEEELDQEFTDLNPWKKKNQSKANWEHLYCA